VNVDQRLADDQSQPDEAGVRGIGQEMTDPLRGAQVRLLQNVIGIDPSVQPVIQPKVDRPPQSLPVPIKQLGQRLLVTLHNAVDQLGLGRIVGSVAHAVIVCD
jgi:hypothetical protein